MRNLLRQIVIVTSLSGCEPTTPTVKPAEQQQENPSASPAQEQLDLSSADAVTAALEKRWSLDAIKTFCIPERRHNTGYQNLVAAEGETWGGALYENEKTGFDSITWYGAAVDGKLFHYSLNVNRGDDWWLLEIGNAKYFDTPPDVSPDPSQPHFVGGK
jgi:hypothetical protein